MRTYLLKRLFLIIPTLLGITLVTFFVIQLAPGNPVSRKLQVGEGVKAEAITKDIIEQTKKLYGLDKPIYVRYWIWLKQIATLDFGRSYKDHRPVIQKIAERLPVTLSINIIRHITLPVICLTYGDLAYLARYQRGSLLEVLRSEFIRTARAKGLTESNVIFKHALRNALIPIITIVASVLPAMIGGSVIIESIFSIPGIGQLGFEAVLSRDYPLIMAIATISAFLTLIGILISDLAYVMVDPRISFEGKR